MAQLLNMFLLCKGGGSMGVLMPIYTVAIIVFFVYTTMKVIEELLRLPYHTDKYRREGKGRCCYSWGTYLNVALTI